VSPRRWMGVLASSKLLDRSINPRSSPDRAFNIEKGDVSSPLCARTFLRGLPAILPIQLETSLNLFTGNARLSGFELMSG
jgi:hypothetical protein